MVAPISTTLAVLDYIANHIQVLGWTGLGIVAWKGRGYIDDFLSSVKLSDQRLLETRAIAVEVKAGVDAIQNNHLTHMEKDMSGLAEKQDTTIELLTSIDKGIAILADRGNRDS